MSVLQRPLSSKASVIGWGLLLGLVWLLVLPSFACGQSSSAASDLTARQQQLLYQAQQALQAQEYPQVQKPLTAYLKRHKQAPAQFYLLLGNSYYQQQVYSRAQEYYRQGLQQHPQRQLLAANLAVACYQQQQFIAAAEAFLKAWRLESPSKPDYSWLYKAAAAYYQGQAHDQALQHLETLLQQAPAAAVQEKWLRLELHCLRALEQWSRVVKRAEQLVQRYPQKSFYWQVMAQAHNRQQQYRQAAAALEAAYALEPPGASAWQQLARMYQYVQAPLAAARSWQKCYQLQPSSRDYLQLARLYAQARRYDQAYAYLDAGRQHQPEAHNWDYWQGGYLYRQQRYAAAQAALRRGQKQGQVPKQRCELLRALCALEMENWRQSRNLFRRVARQQGDYAQVAQGYVKVLDAVLQARQQAEKAQQAAKSSPG